MTLEDRVEEAVLLLEAWDGADLASLMHAANAAEVALLLVTGAEILPESLGARWMKLGALTANCLSAALDIAAHAAIENNGASGQIAQHAGRKLLDATQRYAELSARASRPSRPTARA